GRLDVMKAVNFLDSTNTLPPPDRFEPNDSLSQSHKLWGRRPALDATLDFWDDHVDDYRVRLVRGERLHARLTAGWPNASVGLTFLSLQGRQPARVAHTAHPGRTQQLSFPAPHTGWYAVKLRIEREGGGRYALHLRKSG